MASLRKAVNEKCRDCIYDDLAAGTWRQQVHLCSSYSCPLWPHRPKSASPIPASVLEYYGVPEDDLCLRNAQNGPVSDSDDQLEGLPVGIEIRPKDTSE